MPLPLSPSATSLISNLSLVMQTNTTSNILSVAKKAFNQAMYQPTAQRKASAKLAIQALLDALDATPEAKPAKVSKPAKRKPAAKPAKAAALTSQEADFLKFLKEDAGFKRFTDSLGARKAAKRTPEQVVADTQERKAAAPKSFAITKADKAVAAKRVAQQQADAAAREVARKKRKPAAPKPAKAAKPAAPAKPAKRVKAVRPTFTAMGLADMVKQEGVVQTAPKAAKPARKAAKPSSESLKLSALQDLLMQTCGVDTFIADDAMPF